MKKNPPLYGILAIAFSTAAAFTMIGLKAADDGDAAAPKRRVVAAAERQWQHLAFETEPEKATSGPAVAEQIVKLGDDGWELVTVLNFNSEGTTTRTVYYFKKPR